MGRVYARTGSVLVAVLMHASLTAGMQLFQPAVSGGQAVAYDLVFGAVLWLFVGALALTGLPARPQKRDSNATWAPSSAFNVPASLPR